MSPHDIKILPDSDRTGKEALVERLVHADLEVRVELKLQDGSDSSTVLTREDAELLELHEGQIVSVRLLAPRTPTA